MIAYRITDNPYAAEASLVRDLLNMGFSKQQSDAFLDAGALPTLHDRYGISTAAVSDQIKAWL